MSKKAREIVKEQVKGESNYPLTFCPSNLYIEEIIKSFDKAIITLKIALNKLGLIIDTMEDNWIFYEILMYHKNMLHTQIDLLIREKKKCNNKHLSTT